jgi:hypothetical protein
MKVFIVEIMKQVGETKKLCNTWVTEFDWIVDSAFLSEESAHLRCKEVSQATIVTTLEVQE